MTTLTIEKENINIKRPMMHINQMVEYLKQKNIKFNYITEEEAEIYLKKNNNYYNVTSYKNNFAKYQNKENYGKYVDLDFAYLKDLAIIDMRLRTILFKMIMDIEHYLKISILNQIELIEAEDGYTIVNKYLDNDYNDIGNNKRIHKSILKKVGSEYYKKIFDKYELNDTDKIQNIPIWEFLEIITFGELVDFYSFYTKEYDLVKDKRYIFILREIVKLRNAVAHNSCVISELDKKNNDYSPDYAILQFLNECGIGSKSRNVKLSNSRIRQITYTLYFFNKIVTSDGVKNNIKEELNELLYVRILAHKQYYKTNELLKSIYIYFCKIIDKIYKI